MKKSFFIAFTAILLTWVESVAQKTNDGLVGGIPPKIFTLHNARFAVGFGGDINFRSDDGSSIFHHYLGKPDDVKLSYNNETVPYWDLSLTLDLYSPNSVLSFMGEANFTTYQFNTDFGGKRDRFSIKAFEFPLFLKIKLGDVHKKNHLLLMPGIGYSAIFKYRQESPLGVSTDKSNVENHFNYQFIIGYDYGFTSDDHNYNDDVRTMLFLRAVYNQNYFTNDVLSGGNGEFDFSDLNIAIGAKFFFRLAGK